MPFDEIVTSLIRMAEDSVVLSRPLRFEVSGELGEVPAEVATPLAVVLAELLQNAIEHGFPDFLVEADGGARREGPEETPSASADPGRILIRLDNPGNRMVLEVVDNGLGLPDGFDIDETTSLGLSIVRDLIRSQLEGTITMRDRRRERADADGSVRREADGSVRREADDAVGREADDAFGWEGEGTDSDPAARNGSDARGTVVRIELPVGEIPSAGM